MSKYYIVGGYVRDSLLGISSKDVDFAVEAESYEAMKADLISKGVKIFLESPEYFTIRGTHPTYGAVDYVLCRKDGTYTDGRHPDSVSQGTIIDDLARRDFTIGAIAMDADTKQLIDPFDGQTDLKNKIIRCVGDPEKRFTEDSLRILRAIRFSIRLGFTIEPDTFEAMYRMADSVNSLPAERIREEMEKCFRMDTLRTIEFLLSLNLMGVFKGNLWLMPTFKAR